MASQFVNLPESGGGSGAVDSVNGQTGVVVLDAADVGAITWSTPVDANIVPDTNSTYTIGEDGNGFTTVFTDGVAGNAHLNLQASAGDVRIFTDGSVQLLTLSTGAVPLVLWDGTGSYAVSLQAAPTATGSYDMILPPDVGAAGSVLTDVAGDGILSWEAAGGGGANTALSNLVGPTAINEDLIFDKLSPIVGTQAESDVSFHIRTGEGSTDINTGPINISSGNTNAGEGNTGNVTIVSGNNNSSGAGFTGELYLNTGTSVDSASTGFTGSIQITSGDHFGLADTGMIRNRSGAIYEATSAANTGRVEIATGQNDGTGDTGAISLETGVPASGTRGAIKFINGSEGNIGDVWTSTNADGSGEWATPSASFPLRGPDGVPGAPTYSFASGTTSGLSFVGTSPYIVSNGTIVTVYDAAGLYGHNSNKDLGADTLPWNRFFSNHMSIAATRAGLATLVGGTVTVSTAAVSANSQILVTSNADGGVPGFLRVINRSNGVGFDIQSSNVADTSSVAWFIIDKF